jgi:hypothetical protein
MNNRHYSKITRGSLYEILTGIHDTGTGQQNQYADYDYLSVFLQNVFLLMLNFPGYFLRLLHPLWPDILIMSNAPVQGKETFNNRFDEQNRVQEYISVKTTKTNPYPWGLFSPSAMRQ